VEILFDMYKVAVELIHVVHFFTDRVEPLIDCSYTVID